MAAVLVALGLAVGGGGLSGRRALAANVVQSYVRARKAGNAAAACSFLTRGQQLAEGELPDDGVSNDDFVTAAQAAAAQCSRALGATDVT